MGVCKTGPGRGVEKITGQGQLEAPGDGGAIDRADDRFAAVPDRHHQRGTGPHAAILEYTGILAQFL